MDGYRKMEDGKMGDGQMGDGRWEDGRWEIGNRRFIIVMDLESLERVFRKGQGEGRSQGSEGGLGFLAVF